MRVRGAAWAPALLAAALACAATGAAPTRRAPPVAITDVGVVDVALGRIHPHRTVLVVGNRISAVGAAAAVKVPKGARVIDGAGKYLVPGLWDMHTHLTFFDRSALRLLLAWGVTGVRDMSAERFATAKGLRDSIAAGRLVGPRMRIASPVVENAEWLAWTRGIAARTGTPWTLYERFGPASADQVARWVDSVAALGADHIKVRNWPSRELGAALVAAAKARGLDVVGHANEPFPRDGVASYEHGIWPASPTDSAARAAIWRGWAGRRAAFTPTLVTWPIRLSTPESLIARISAGTLPGIEYVPEATRTKWRHELAGMGQESARDWTAVYRVNLRDAAEMQRAGVPIVAGTDLGAPLIVPGVSLHDELAALVRHAGLSPLEALRAATLEPARLMRLTDSLGTVEPGKIADLVLLDADPLTDIGNTRRISAVVANGRLLDAAAIASALAESAAH